MTLPPPGGTLGAPPRHVDAGNAGPFTLDGTRTWLVGERHVAVIDPGPASDTHVDAVARALAGAERVTVLVTHGHPDHQPAARPLAERVGGTIAGPAGLEGLDRALEDGDRVETDQGELVALDTPGHARLHQSFHWPAARALFAGDLLLGRGDTVWVGEYEGAVADYLASLERLRALDLAVIYPAHGPALEDPADAIERFVRHRLERVRRMEAVLDAMPGADAEALLEAVYGDRLSGRVREAALRSVAALKAHVEAGRR
ncbi:MAG TPA: MBL fold metallo-hydrolase [Longimicrobiales bacterium]|nr:MBL fold metallo-hydrolase [Longimicrobiales bacterium]